ncbi:MAG: glycosyltransferase family 2 protein [Planctomycetota bacterium]
MTPAFAVIICTRDGARRLPGVLDDLAREASTAPADWELVVVDNGSADDSAEVARSYADRLPVRVAVEPEAGLARARNRALAATSAPAVVFLDDDVRVDAGWLAAWRDALAAASPAGWFGGTVLPTWPDGKPGWVRDERLELLAGVYGLHRVSPRTVDHAEGHPLPIGAHFAVRRSAFERVGPFRHDLGLVGRRRGLGEETEWFGRALAQGVGGRHVGEAVVRHPVPRRRLRLSALVRHGVLSGVAHARIHANAPRGSRARALLHVLRGVGQWVRGRGDRFRQCLVNAGIELGLRREQAARVHACKGAEAGAP